MNRHFRTVSALLRHTWAVDETWAEGQLPLINAYLAGNYAGPMLSDDEEPRPIGYAMAPQTKTSNSARSRQPTGHFTRYELESDSMFSDPAIPAGSVGIIDVRGAIMKEGFCGSYGTEDYTRELKAIYANDSLIGSVVLVDSGGGQLYGTPSFYDAIRNPVKPVVVLVNDGIMASAAYWLACGADYIMASQPTDQIGSIGVFCRLRDSSKKLEQDGVKEISVYAKRSKDKNKSYRDALKGDTKLLEAELGESVDFFETAVLQGRGKKLAVTADDEPFTGKLYYAEQAIAIGLVDGMGDLDAAVAKVQELATETPTPSGRTSAEAASTASDSTDSSTHLDASPDALDPQGDTPPTSPSAEATDQPQSNQTTNDMTFGDKHKKLSALSGVEASAITDEHLNEVNGNLDSMNITGARVISTSYLQEAEQAVTALATANATIETLTRERDEARKEAEKFGDQPGHLGSKNQKTEEKTGADQNPNDRYYSETDAEQADRSARMNKPA